MKTPTRLLSALEEAIAAIDSELAEIEARRIELIKLRETLWTSSEKPPRPLELAAAASERKPYHHPTEETKALVFELRGQNLTHPEIARRTNLSVSTVIRILRTQRAIA